MSWTAGSSSVWALAAVPINPASTSVVIDNTSTKYKEDVTKSPDTTYISDAGFVWTSDQSAPDGYTFSGGTWTGQITVDGILTSADYFDVEIGYTNSPSFTAVATIPFQGDGSTTKFEINEYIASLTVPMDGNLALRIVSTAGDPFYIKSGWAYSYVTAPDAPPGYPLAEIAAGLLFGLGLVALGVMIWYRKRHKVVAVRKVE